jgi:hypothetical protein
LAQAVQQTLVAGHHELVAFLQFRAVRNNKLAALLVTVILAEAVQVLAQDLQQD